MEHHFEMVNVFWIFFFFWFMVGVKFCAKIPLGKQFLEGLSSWTPWYTNGIQKYLCVSPLDTSYETQPFSSPMD